MMLPLVIINMMLLLLLRVKVFTHLGAAASLDCWGGSWIRPTLAQIQQKKSILKLAAKVGKILLRAIL